MLSNRHLEHLVSYNYGASLVYKQRKNVPWHQFFEAIQAKFVRFKVNKVFNLSEAYFLLLFNF